MCKVDDWVTEDWVKMRDPQCDNGRSSSREDDTVAVIKVGDFTTAWLLWIEFILYIQSSKIGEYNFSDVVKEEMAELGNGLDVGNGGEKRAKNKAKAVWERGVAIWREEGLSEKTGVS